MATGVPDRQADGQKSGGGIDRRKRANEYIQSKPADRENRHPVGLQSFGHEHHKGQRHQERVKVEEA
jgi:hypothetical protein